MRFSGGPVILLLFAGIVILSNFLAAAQPAANQPPTTRVTDCTTSGCHASETTRKFLHGPNAVQACDACHEHLDPAKHTFQLKRPGRQLCDFCHIDKTGTEGTVVHKPVANGECLGCHDPHGASNRRMLKKETTPELCTQCHKEVLSGSHAHGPAAHDCVTCHKAHTSNFEHLLTMEKRSLCLSCHEEVGKTIAGAKHPHEPTKGDCLQCHQPHSTNQVKALKVSPKELCSSCHQEVAHAAAASKHQHSAVSDDRACLNCHIPHGSDREAQLPKDPATACLACHRNPIVISKERTVPGIPELGVDTLHKHGPVAMGECAGCHDVHGGERDRLLTGNYSMGFYQQFSETTYELCFKCHDKSLVLAQSATSETRFRDGSRNLHAVHVNNGPQGRSCRACHSVHASKFELQINESVPFGQWKLPINFQPAENGGSCSPGCHKPAKYDRGTSSALPATTKPAAKTEAPPDPDKKAATNPPPK